MCSVVAGKLTVTRARMSGAVPRDPTVHIREVSDASLCDLGIEEVHHVCGVYDQEVARGEAAPITWDQVRGGTGGKPGVVLAGEEPGTRRGGEHTG